MKDHEFNPDFCQDDVHAMFGLSYANYLTIPRSLLQSMPPEWQHKMRALMDEFTDRYSGYDLDYRVQKVDERGRFAIDPLSDYQRGRRYVEPKSMWDDVQLSDASK